MKLPSIKKLLVITSLALVVAECSQNNQDTKKDGNAEIEETGSKGPTGKTISKNGDNIGMNSDLSLSIDLDKLKVDGDDMEAEIPTTKC